MYYEEIFEIQRKNYNLTDILNAQLYDLLALLNLNQSIPKWAIKYCNKSLNLFPENESAIIIKTIAQRNISLKYAEQRYLAKLPDYLIPAVTPKTKNKALQFEIFRQFKEYQKEKELGHNLLSEDLESRFPLVRISSLRCEKCGVDELISFNRENNIFIHNCGGKIKAEMVRDRKNIPCPSSGTANCWTCILDCDFNPNLEPIFNDYHSSFDELKIINQSSEKDTSIKNQYAPTQSSDINQEKTGQGTSSQEVPFNFGFRLLSNEEILRFARNLSRKHNKQYHLISEKLIDWLIKVLKSRKEPVSNLEIVKKITSYIKYLRESDS
jgi:hypothetical protein